MVDQEGKKSVLLRHYDIPKKELKVFKFYTMRHVYQAREKKGKSQRDTRTHLDLENPDLAQRQKSADIAGGQQQLISEDEAHVLFVAVAND